MITEFDFNLASGSNSWRRVGDLHPIDLYYGKDNKGRNAIEYKGKFMVNSKIHSSVLIEIVHYKNGDGSKSIVFSLLDNKFLKPFCDFAFSLLDGVINSDIIGKIINSHCVNFVTQTLFNLFLRYTDFAKRNNHFLYSVNQRLIIVSCKCLFALIDSHIHQVCGKNCKNTASQTPCAHIGIDFVNVTLTCQNLCLAAYLSNMRIGEVLHALCVGF